LNVAVDFGTLSNVAVIDYYVSVGATVGFAGRYVGHKSNTDITISANTIDIVLWSTTNSSAGLGVGSGQVTFGGIVRSCATCLSSNVDVIVNGQLKIAGVAQPFTAVHNPYTIDYSVAEATFAVPAAKIVVAAGASTDVYIIFSAATGRSSETTKFGYFKDTMPSTIAAALVTPNQIYPRGQTASAASGSYSTGAVTLTEGTWYVAPYCVSKGTSPVTNNCEFDFAIGLGSEPAAASHVTAGSALLIAAVSVIISLAL